jgi:hypothetical protein
MAVEHKHALRLDFPNLTSPPIGLVVVRIGLTKLKDDPFAHNAFRVDCIDHGLHVGIEPVASRQLAHTRLLVVPRPCYRASWTAGSASQGHILPLSHRRGVCSIIGGDFVNCAPSSENFLDYLLGRLLHDRQSLL